MKLERLLSIVILLISKRKVLAKDLAEMFDVSVRTIYRDIEAINQAGIPIVTYQGTYGGIGITDGYRLEKNLLSSDDLVSIATALKSMSASYQDTNVEALLQKIKGLVPQNEEEEFKTRSEQIFIDFTPWGREALLKDKFKVLKDAISSGRCVSFVYLSAKGEATERSVEPYTLVLKGQKWYLYAFCKLRSEFRLFKLSRIREIELLSSVFTRRQINLNELPWDKEWQKPDNIVNLLLRFHEKVGVVAEEWFGVEKLLADGKGGYLVETALPEDDWLYGFLLSFGQYVEVVEPAHIRRKIEDISLKINSIYKKS
ncbi:MAG: helix-turn-helix transcriptional regulator [Bacillota bacterium]